MHGSSSSPPGCRGPGGRGDGGRSGDCADAAAGIVSQPVSVVGVRASDGNDGGVGDDPVSRVGDGAGRGVSDGACSWVGRGTRDVVGEAVCIGATSGTYI